MIKGILEFDLENYDSKRAYDRCNKANDIVNLLKHYTDNGYAIKVKYNEDLSEDYQEGFKSALVYLYELLEQLDINLENL